MVDLSTANVKRVNFFVVLRNVRYIIGASYNRSKRECQVEFGEAKSSVKGHELSDPLCFPVALKGRGDTPWSIELTAYDSVMDTFLLTVNGNSFMEMPEGEIMNEGPQLIKEGEILLNGKSALQGVKQYQEWKEGLPKQPEVTEVCIDDLKCSSSAVLNSIIDDISQCIDPYELVGLRSFELRGFRNMVNFEKWPL